MIHMSYDYAMVAGSAIAAVIVCFIAISFEQLINNKRTALSQKILLVLSGMIFGLAIWVMHFVGMLACHLPEGYRFDTGLTFFSYVIAALASIFAVWLITRETLPLGRLVLGSLLMGAGISGMHYTGMAGLIVPQYIIHYDSIFVVFSILVAICGSGLSFWLLFKYKRTYHNKLLFKLAVAFMIAFSIVGMHYIGMSAASYHPVDATYAEMNNLHEGHGLLLFIIIAVTCLVLVVSFFVAILELRLEERNQQLIRMNKELENLALQDNLTKLPNRLFLLDYTTSLFSLHQSKDQKQVAFIYIDLDRFKSVNDGFGHHVGDQLLVNAAHRLHALLKSNQKLIRIGGDEFLLVLEDFSEEEIDQISNLVLQKMQETFVISGKDINISASLGVVYYPDHGTDLHDLLVNADIAMLMSKEQGRNTYSIFNYSLDQQELVRSQSQLINDFYRAVEEQQFVLFYQPKFTADFKICGVEALIRWQHPTLGLLAPNMFIEGAEQTGLIIKMGYWALDQACLQIQSWQQKKYPFCPIAVNLSAVQFEHKALIDTLRSLIAKYKIDPAHLIIEITESTAMHHIDVSIKTFESLRDLGIGLAIDDFGTGHSSFLYLKKLPVDELKIDREFIRNISPNSKDEIVLESIIVLAKRLGLVVTAEGVETQKQADILKRLGCQQLQGYLLGMPLPVDRLEISFKNY
jgi:diguanylate cyclase